MDIFVGKFMVDVVQNSDLSRAETALELDRVLFTCGIKHDPNKLIEKIHPELKNLLSEFRSLRGFNPQACIDAKAELLNQYFRDSNLSGAVVGVSGGIDSAVVLGLLKYASSKPNSPIKKIVAPLLPVQIETGVTNQDHSVLKGSQVVEHFDVDAPLIDLGPAHKIIDGAIASALEKDSSEWAKGQLVSNIRTPIFYHIAAALSSSGVTSIVCGTTNRDEGSYIGYFGKVADGAVDLQLISDLHKSEVYQIAEVLGVPSAVAEAPPSGDVFDGRTDFEMIGTPYDFIELYTIFLGLPEKKQKKILSSLSPEALEQFELLRYRLDERHRVNAHKYLVGNAAIHLDIYKRTVPKGWKESGRTQRPMQPINSPGLKDEFNLTEVELRNFLETENFVKARKKTISEKLPLQSVFAISDILSQLQVKMLINTLDKRQGIAVDQNGRNLPEDAKLEEIGSIRSTLVSENIAKLIWERIRSSLDAVRVIDDFTPTDVDVPGVWRPVGVSPVLRFMTYGQGGLIVPHYDAAFDYGDGKRRTLMSFVIYLTDADVDQGGLTRFIKDKQNQKPRTERDFNDWNRKAKSEEVLVSVLPQSGSGILFDHRMLHDASEWKGESSRIIIRTDIIFEKCGIDVN